MPLLSRPRPAFNVHISAIHLADSKLHCGSRITVATSMGWTPIALIGLLSVCCTLLSCSSTTVYPVWMLLHNVYPGLSTTLFAVLGCCCKEVQSQMGLFCGPGFVHLRTMLAMMWYPSTGGPFLLSHVKCGSHVELLEFRGLACLPVKTRRTVPFLIDMKIFYALLKM